VTDRDRLEILARRARRRYRLQIAVTVFIVVMVLFFAAVYLFRLGNTLVRHP
jgi:hypothetical protein